MKNFTVTAFADEISGVVDKQIAGLKEQKISHIELRGLDGKNVSELTLEDAKKYKRKFDDAEIKISSIGSPIGKINVNDPFEPHLELFKHVLKIAEIFESPYIRMFSFFISKDEKAEDHADEVVRRWRLFVEIAKNYPEITLLHENEKDIFGDTPERCRFLFDKLKADNVQAAFDPANFVQCEVEVYPRAFNLLKDKIAYMHIKDARFSDHEVRPAGMGDGKIKEVLTKLVDQEFNGFVSLEPHLSLFDGFSQLEGEQTKQLKKDDNERMFVVASEALKKILKEMDQEWK